MTEIKQLLTAFERYAYGQSLHTAFTQLLDWTLLPFKKYDSAADQQYALETYRSHPKVNQLVSLISLIGDLSEGFGLDISSGSRFWCLSVEMRWCVNSYCLYVNTTLMSDYM